MTRLHSHAGFTLVELLVASGLTTVVASGAFSVLIAAQGAFVVQPEAGDVQQRLRVAADVLTKDLAAAELVLPYRTGLVSGDAPGSYRDGTICALSSLPPHDGPAIVNCYYFRADTLELRHYDGGLGDFPVLDEIVALTFSYFGGAAGAAPLGGATFTDGPWYPDAAHPERVDADLLSVRRVRVRLRAEASTTFRGPPGALFARAGVAATPARWVPDQEVQFDVALRNSRLAR